MYKLTPDIKLFVHKSPNEIKEIVLSLRLFRERPFLN